MEHNRSCGYGEESGIRRKYLITTTTKKKTVRKREREREGVSFGAIAVFLYVSPVVAPTSLTDKKRSFLCKFLTRLTKTKKSKIICLLVSTSTLLRLI